MSLHFYTTHELLTELKRRADKCSCGPLRREIRDEHQGFTTRIGCLTCNTWDDPKVRVIGRTS